MTLYRLKSRIEHLSKKVMTKKMIPVSHCDVFVSTVHLEQFRMYLKPFKTSSQASRARIKFLQSATAWRKKLSLSSQCVSVCVRLSPILSSRETVFTNKGKHTPPSATLHYIVPRCPADIEGPHLRCGGIFHFGPLG